MSLSSQSTIVGHLPGPALMAVSQVSPASTTPLPHFTGQSRSVSEVAPLGQQPSLASRLAVSVVLAHLRVQAPPERESLVQASLSSQSARVGHLPAPEEIPGSQVSPLSSRPLPHPTGQSRSVSEVAPAGQQPSFISRLAVITVLEHLTRQELPSSVSLVQEFLSSQSSSVGHLPAPRAILVSQFSPASSTPLPHTTGQSRSVRELAPEGQQPSLVARLAVRAVLEHLTLQVLPVRESLVQAFLSSQSARDGHLPGPVRILMSHPSPASMTPLPHTGKQSLSVRELAPGGQQPSLTVLSAATAPYMHFR